MEHLKKQERELAVRIIRMGLIFGVAAVLFAVFSPFLSVLAWSLVLCYALHPLHKRVLRATGRRRSLSASIMCLVLAIGFILPITSLSLLLVDELTRTYTMVAHWIAKEENLYGGWENMPVFAQVLERMDEYQRLTGNNPRDAVAANLTHAGGLLVTKITKMATNLALGVLELGFVMISAFFFFRDGDAMVSGIEDMLPFSRRRQEQVFQHFDDVVKGSIYGNAIVSVLCGVVGGLAFWVTGLHGPVLWGTVMAILAYLPMVGATLVWAPAIVYLFFKAAYVKMAVMAVAGGIIFIIDHVVRNIVVASRVQLHPLLVLFSVLGGVHLFGLLGLIAGPLAVALAKTLLEEYAGGEKLSPVSEEPPR
jgi:predicted PurR-regulated permease PerM